MLSHAYKSWQEKINTLNNKKGKPLKKENHYKQISRDLLGVIERFAVGFVLLFACGKVNQGLPVPEFVSNNHLQLVQKFLKISEFSNQYLWGNIIRNGDQNSVIATLIFLFFQNYPSFSWTIRCKWNFPIHPLSPERTYTSFLFSISSVLPRYLLILWWSPYLSNPVSWYFDGIRPHILFGHLLCISDHHILGKLWLGAHLYDPSYMWG